MLHIPYDPYLHAARAIPRNLNLGTKQHTDGETEEKLNTPFPKISPKKASKQGFLNVGPMRFELMIF